MSTNSLIGILNKDKSIEVVYCHFDGYLEHVGITLYKDYSDIKKVRTMLLLGDLSSLGNFLGDKKNKLKEGESYCVFYNRDRGEKTKSQKYENIENFYKSTFEFNYLLDEEDGEWYLVNKNKKINLKKELINLNDERINKYMISVEKNNLMDVINVKDKKKKIEIKKV